MRKPRAGLEGAGGAAEPRAAGVSLGVCAGPSVVPPCACGLGRRVGWVRACSATPWDGAPQSLGVALGGRQGEVTLGDGAWRLPPES